MSQSIRTFIKGEGTIQTHRDQKHRGNGQNTAEVETLEKPDSLRWLHKTVPGTDIDPHCLGTLLAGLIYIFDLVVFGKFTKAQNLVSNRKRHFCFYLIVFVYYSIKTSVFQLENEKNKLFFFVFIGDIGKKP